MRVFKDAHDRDIKVGDWIIGAWPKGYLLIGKVEGFTDKTVVVSVQNGDTNPNSIVKIPESYLYRTMLFDTINVDFAQH